MAYSKDFYPSYDEDTLRNNKAVAGQFLEAAGAQGREVIEEGGVPLMTNVPGHEEPGTVYITNEIMGNYGAKIPPKPTDQQLSVAQKMQAMIDDMKQNVKGFQSPFDIDPVREGEMAKWKFLQTAPKNIFDEPDPKYIAHAEVIGKAAATDAAQVRTQALSMFHQAASMQQQEDMKKLAAQTKTPNMIELQRLANAGDPNAQAILDKISERKIKEGEAVGEGRTKGYGKIRLTTVVDTQNPDPDTRLKTMNINQFNEANAKEPGRYVQASQSPEQKEAMSQAVQRGGATTSNVVAAVKMYTQEAPELIELRERVREKGLLPESGFKDIGALNQWLGAKTNDQDTALLQKKTKFLADSLMRVIGGSQGGEWAFKVASDILDPSYSPEAFSGIVNSHGEAMIRMAKARTSFGKSDIPESMAGGNKVDMSQVVETRIGKSGKRLFKLKDGRVVSE